MRRFPQRRYSLEKPPKETKDKKPNKNKKQQKQTKTKQTKNKQTKNHSACSPVIRLFRSVFIFPAILFFKCTMNFITGRLANSIVNY